MRRRTLLAGVAAAAGGSGCLGSLSPRADSETPTASVVLRAAIRYVANDDAIRVDAPGDDQFAFVRPPTVGEATSSTEASPPPSAFTLELGREQFTPRSTIPGFDLDTPGVGSAYTDDSRAGWLVFDLPTVEATRGALVHGSDRYPIPSDRLDGFAAVPAFTVRSVSVPDSVAPDETIEVAVEVANDGERDGRS